MRPENFFFFVPLGAKTDVPEMLYLFTVACSKAMTAVLFSAELLAPTTTTFNVGAVHNLSQKNVSLQPLLTNVIVCSENVRANGDTDQSLALKEVFFLSKSAAMRIFQIYK